MRRAARARRSLVGRLSGERGYTLVELVVAMAVGLVVFAALLTAVVEGAGIENHTANRAQAELSAQAGLAELGRLIRQATSVSYVGAGQAQIALSGGPLGATTINCTSGTCVVSGGSTSQVLSGLSNTNVFTLECRAAGSTASDLTTSGCSTYTFVAITAQLKLQCGGENSCPANTVTFDDGFNLGT